MQRYWDDLTRIAQQELTLSTHHNIHSLIRLVFIASHRVCYLTMTSLDLPINSTLVWASCRQLPLRFQHLLLLPPSLTMASLTFSPSLYPVIDLLLWSVTPPLQLTSWLQSITRLRLHMLLQSLWLQLLLGLQCCCPSYQFGLVSNWGSGSHSSTCGGHGSLLSHCFCFRFGLYSGRCFHFQACFHSNRSVCFDHRGGYSFGWSSIYGFRSGLCLYFQSRYSWLQFHCYLRVRNSHTGLLLLRFESGSHFGWARSWQVWLAPLDPISKVGPAWVLLPLLWTQLFPRLCFCWTSQNIMEPVCVRVRPCVQWVPGPIQAVALSEAKSFTAVKPS